MQIYTKQKGLYVMKKILVKSIAATTITLTSMFLWSQTAEAYIDPSVATYVIQAVAGIIIAAGAVIGIYWRKAKKKINKTLGVDENRNKEVESDDIITKAETTEKTEK